MKAATFSGYMFVHHSTFTQWERIKFSLSLFVLFFCILWKVVGNIYCSLLLSEFP